MRGQFFICAYGHILLFSLYSIIWSETVLDDDDHHHHRHHLQNGLSILYYVAHI